MKPANKARHALLVSLIAGSTMAATGCSSSGISMASLNPFSNSQPSPLGQPDSSPGITESIAATTSTAGDKVRSVGVSAKGMLGRTTNAMTSVFRRDKTESETEKIASTDPLRLDNKPDQVDPEVFVASGQLWESTGDFAKAMESYNKALANHPKHAPALTSMARLQFRQDNLTEAITYFQRAIAEKPGDAGLHNDLGLTLSKLGNRPAAIASLQKALTLAPGTSRYANNLASVQFEGGDSTSAFGVLMQNNKPAVAHFNMAYLYYKNSQMAQAKSHLAEAVKFEEQSSKDPSTGRAVQRSRDMLAQINASEFKATPGTPATSPTGNMPGVSGGAAIAQTPSPQAPATAPNSTVPPQIADARIPGMPSYTAPAQRVSYSGAVQKNTAGMGPAMANIKPPVSTTTATEPAKVKSPVAPAAAAQPVSSEPSPVKQAEASPAAVEKWNSWNPAKATLPTKAATAQPEATTPKSPDAADAKPVNDETKPAPASPSGFALPEGFTLPGSN